MNSDEFGAFIFGLFVAFMVMLLLGLGITSEERASWEKQCIEHGAAQYNPTTGEFEWKEKVEDGSK